MILENMCVFACACTRAIHARACVFCACASASASRKFMFCGAVLCNKDNIHIMIPHTEFITISTGPDIHYCYKRQRIVNWNLSCLMH